MIFWKNSDVVQEETRLANLKALYDNGELTVSQYLDAINKLKSTTDGGSSSTVPNVLNTVQMALLLGLVVAGVYVLRTFKK